MFSLWIGGRLPGLNELLSGNRASGKWNAYNQIKGQWYGQIKTLVAAHGIPMQGPGYATALWIEPHRQRDPDNIVSGGFKLLLDAFVGSEVLPGDGWGNNLGFIGYWEARAGQAGCLFHWGDEILSKPEMLLLLEKEKGNGNSSNDQNRTGPGATRHARPGAHYPKATRRRA